MFGRIKQFFWDSRMQSTSLVVAVAVVILGILFLFDAGFATGLGLLVLLSIATVWALRKLKIAERHALILFVAVLLTHALFASFVYFADFQPFSGGQGDYESYHKQAERIVYGLWEGDFSGRGQFALLHHHYPAVLGILYTLLFPSIIIGQLFNVWIAALALLFLYFIVRELGSSPSWALVTGLIATVYPSFVFYTSLTLKDVFVALYVLVGLLLVLRILRTFTWKEFAVLYIVLLALNELRFYVGIIFLGSFVVAWLFASSFGWRKRILYAAAIVPLLGFVPYFTSSSGYFGLGAVFQYANVQQVSFYKEKVYSPEFAAEQLAAQQEAKTSVLSSEEVKSQTAEKEEAGQEPKSDDSPKIDAPKLPDYTSSTDLRISFDNPIAFIKTFTESFLFAVVGPFPWQFKGPRHYLVLLETLPWSILFFFIVKGAIRSFKEDRRVLMLLLFSIGLLALLALFFSNFGITTRIRIPAFLTLLVFIPLAFQMYKRKSVE